MFELDLLHLWPHQRAAVDLCQDYLQAKPEGSALVHLPTGSGKTGVMATVSVLAAQTKPALILCPSAALVEQLDRQISGAFWQKVGAAPEWSNVRTTRLLLTRIDETLVAIAQAGQPPLVVLATIQALQDVHGDDRYGAFIDAFSVVFFDEGHREPAPHWAQAARDLGAPMVLLSATPYRNDFKLFDVDLDYISFLSFTDAIRRGLIRPVEIAEADLPDSAPDFVARVISQRDRWVADGQVRPGDKMIVRAESEDQVQALSAAFQARLAQREEGVLALHHTLSDEGRPGAWELSRVPADLAARPEKFLIHQNMLIEGIDDPACTMLALYSTFGNERQLVQQVGRLTRHPGPVGAVAEPARVLARRSDRIEAMWNRFLAFDAACVENGGQPPMKDGRFIDQLIEATPAMDYFEGQFRRRIDFGAETLSEEIRAPRSAIVFDTADEFDFNVFLDALDSALLEEDRFVRATHLSVDGQSAYRLSVKLRQTPFLAESLFQSASLELTLAARLGQRVYVYDSAGLAMDDLPGISGRVRPRLMGSLLPRASRVTSITARNTDLGPHSLRSRTLAARSVETAGVFMGEQTYVVTRASGFSSQTRRAIGFSTSRVRDGEGSAATINEFVEWCQALGQRLDANLPGADLFNRFATPITPPADTTPLNILIDLDTDADRFRDEEGVKVVFDPDDLCVGVMPAAGGPRGYQHAFVMTLNGDPVKVWIRWDAKKKKYWLKSSELSRIYDRNNPKVTLAARLNRTQPFRIILQGSTVFAYGQFYSVDLQLGRPSGPAALVVGMLNGVATLNGLGSEKGGLTAPAVTWPPGSLFGIIDAALAEGTVPRPFGEPFDAFVCDDLGDEAADFIGVSESDAGRVVFVIAKWKGGTAGAGASNLYDVCGQALKNLAYLKTDGQSLPGSTRKFDSDWSLTPRNAETAGKVARRRYGPGSLAFRSAFNRVRGRPNARREIWLVLGQGILSESAVRTALRTSPPEPHVLQMFHLLLSAHASCQSVGVELKIFCSP